jgi:hypothetical protein
VYCNPDARSNITQRDRVFVLGKDIPKDLMADYNENAIIESNAELDKR